MATHDYVIANGTGAAVRSDLNDALAAIVSNNSSATAPATTYAYQWWPDTTTGLLKIRNAANNAWVTVGTLASANLGLLSLAGGTMTGALAVTAGTAALPGIAVSGDLNTGITSPGADQIAISTGGTSRLAVSTTAITSTLPIRINGSTSGYSELSAPAVAGDQTFLLPSTGGTLDRLNRAGNILQVVRTETSANTSGSVAIPLDNTIPQNTEGFEALTCTITPVSATSKLYIVSTMYAGEPSNSTNDLVAALFRDSTANAFAVSMGIKDVNNLESGAPLYTSAYINSNSTASTTIKARVGAADAAAIVLNIATGGARTYPAFGGVYFSSITIMEVAQ